MSVLACDRTGCDEIMCSRLILDHSAYICRDCWAELLKYKETWPAEMSKAEVRQRIETFMREHPPGSFLPVGENEIDEEFERLTATEAEG